MAAINHFNIDGTGGGLFTADELRVMRGDRDTCGFSSGTPPYKDLIMSLYEVYIINLATYDTLSELVVADSEAKAHVKAFAQAGLGGTSVDDYHFICRRVGDVPSGDEPS